MATAHHTACLDHMTRRLLIPIFLLAATTAAAADTPSTPTAGDLAAQDCARARKQHKTCVLSFTSGDTVDGKVPTGTGENIAVPGRDKHPSLIRLRADFRAEIIKAAENL
jgi:hypothetical protein